MQRQEAVRGHRRHLRDEGNLSGFRKGSVNMTVSVSSDKTIGAITEISTEAL